MFSYHTIILKSAVPSTAEHCCRVGSAVLIMTTSLLYIDKATRRFVPVSMNTKLVGLGESNEKEHPPGV